MVKIKKNVLKSFRHVERTSGGRKVKNIYGARVRGNRDRGRSRLALEISVSVYKNELHAVYSI